MQTATCCQSRHLAHINFVPPSASRCSAGTRAENGTGRTLAGHSPALTSKQRVFSAGYRLKRQRRLVKISALLLLLFGRETGQLLVNKEEEEDEKSLGGGGGGIGGGGWRRT